MMRGVWGVVAVVGLAVWASGLPAEEALDKSLAGHEDGTAWYDLRHLDVEGKGWHDTEAFYDRLPARAQKTVRPAVWNLSRHSAGLCVRFITNAPRIEARWTLTSPNLAMPHMPATGVSGLDLYARTDEGAWRWLGVGRPTGTTARAVLADGIPHLKREYLLYLPLYNGVSSVEIGVPEGSYFAKGHPRGPDATRPVVFYGTSITQGGCASRPGMVHTAIVGRRLNRPVINLGFSGNGKMEPEVAALLGELDAAVYVIDCLPNLVADEVRQRVGPLVAALRKARPETPILLVEDRTYADSFLVYARRHRNEESRAALREAYDRLVSEGVKELYYLPGDGLLGADGEDTVDGSHPTDLGFLRQAEAFEWTLRPILDRGEKSLFDGRSLAGWKKTEFGGEGEVYVEDGKLVLEMGSDMTGVTWTGDLPRNNYEISLEAQRVDGSDFFCGLTFPVGESPCSMIVGGWGGGVVGLSSIDGLDASENETTQFIEFETGRWYKIRLRVRDTKIEAWIDDKQVIDQEIAGRRISIRPEVELSRPLGVASWQTKAALRNLRLKRIEPEAQAGKPQQD